MTTIQAALGDISVEPLINNVQIANVLMRESDSAETAIPQGQIAAVETPDITPFSNDPQEITNSNNRHRLCASVKSSLNLWN